MAATITLTVSSYNGKNSSYQLQGLTLKESTGQLEETARELLQIEDEIKFKAKIKKSDSRKFHQNKYCNEFQKL